MSEYANQFLAANVDGAALLSSSFDEAFVSNVLKVANKIHCKRLVSAATRYALSRTCSHGPLPSLSHPPSVSPHSLNLPPCPSPVSPQSRIRSPLTPSSRVPPKRGDGAQAAGGSGSIPSGKPLRFQRGEGPFFLRPRRRQGHPLLGPHCGQVCWPCHSACACGTLRAPLTLRVRMCFRASACQVHPPLPPPCCLV